MDTDIQKQSWRDVIPVHPACKLFDPYPLSAQELQDLAEDIKANGLVTPIVFLSPGMPEENKPEELLAGQQRLDAMELAGILKIGKDNRLTYTRGDKPYYVDVPIKHLHQFMPRGHYDLSAQTKSKTKHMDIDPYRFVVSENIHRRQLSKADKADAIVAATAKMAPRHNDEMPKRHVKGKVGSTKDPVKAAAVSEGAKVGVSKTSIERAMARAKNGGTTPKKPKAAKPKAKSESKAKAKPKSDLVTEALTLCGLMSMDERKLFIGKLKKRYPTMWKE